MSCIWVFVSYLSLPLSSTQQDLCLVFTEEPLPLGLEQCGAGRWIWNEWIQYAACLAVEEMWKQSRDEVSGTERLGSLEPGLGG